MVYRKIWILLWPYRDLSLASQKLPASPLYVAYGYMFFIFAAISIRLAVAVPVPCSPWHSVKSLFAFPSFALLLDEL